MGRGQKCIGNRELKELICTTQGHELGGGEFWRVGGCRVERERGKNWENCNSIINKIYFKNK